MLFLAEKWKSHDFNINSCGMSLKESYVCSRIKYWGFTIWILKNSRLDPCKISIRRLFPSSELKREAQDINCFHRIHLIKFVLQGLNYLRLHHDLILQSQETRSCSNFLKKYSKELAVECLAKLLTKHRFCNFCASSSEVYFRNLKKKSDEQNILQQSFVWMIIKRKDTKKSQSHNKVLKERGREISSVLDVLDFLLK